MIYALALLPYLAPTNQPDQPQFSLNWSWGLGVALKSNQVPVLPTSSPSVCQSVRLKTLKLR